MPLIERYVLRRALTTFLLTLGVLVATLWLTQVLRELDVVTAKGQAIWMFLMMTVLALPALIQTIAPVALLIACLVTLNNLNNDSEMAVMAAAGASQKAVSRPLIVLGAALMILLTLSYHAIAPASLAGLREIVTRVRADVIAAVVDGGGFRDVDDGLTMYIRDKASDGTFRDIFVSDDRSARESLQYTATTGFLLDQAGGSFLILRDGDLIRENRFNNSQNIVHFETYALDLSRLGGAGAAALYQAKERSSLSLVMPKADGAIKAERPQQIYAELHERITAPLYALVFPLIVLAYLGRARTGRQQRTSAVAAAVALCVALRVGSFAAFAAAGSTAAAVPFLYALPLAGIALGVIGMNRSDGALVPAPVAATIDWAVRIGARILRRFNPSSSGAAA